MNILIVCGSSREKSQSSLVCDLIADRIEMKTEKVSILSISLAGNPIPFWKEGIDDSNCVSGWKNIAHKFDMADAYVFVVPEWNGMAPADVKNLFHMLDTRLVGHKPALIVAVSSGDGGAYVVAELKMFSTKNNFLIYLPEHLILRRISTFLASESSYSDRNKLERVYERIDYSLAVLVEYSKALKRVRESGVLKMAQFRHGM